MWVSSSPLENIDVIKFSVPRPEETEVEDNTTDSRTNTVAVIEGETVFEDTYVKSVETEITIERTFKTPGYVYNLSLIRCWIVLEKFKWHLSFPQLQHARRHCSKHHHELEDSLRQSGQTRGLGARLQQEHPLWYKLQKISIWFYFSATKVTPLRCDWRWSPVWTCPRCQLFESMLSLASQRWKIDWLVNRGKTRRKCLSL